MMQFSLDLLLMFSHKILTSRRKQIFSSWKRAILFRVTSLASIAKQAIFSLFLVQEVFYAEICVLMHLALNVSACGQTTTSNFAVDKIIR